MLHLVKNLVRLLHGTIILLFAGIVLSTMCQVVSRYVFDSPLTWTEELARYLAIWCVFLAAPVGIGHNLHLGIDIITDRLRPVHRKTLHVVQNAFIVILCGFLLVSGIQLVSRVMRNLSPVLGVSMGAVYAAIPVSAVIMASYAVAALYGNVRTFTSERSNSRLVP